MVSRAERGAVADWLRTVDRWLLGSFVALMVIGLVMALAASPAVAERLNLSTLHFVNRQAVMLVPTVILMVATSFLSPRHVRRAALLLFIFSLALIVLALLFGAEVKGARRWIFGLQPSEFIKPAFVVLAAWAFTEGGHKSSTAILAKILSFLILPLTIIPLILEPDFGQTMLVSIVWASLFFMAGLHWFWVAGVGGLGVAGGFAAYKLSPHVHERVLRFINPDASGGVVDTFQVDTALQSILYGRLVWPRTRRGSVQADSSRRPYGFRFCRHRRGVRHGRLHGADPVLRLHRGARPHSLLAQPGSLLPLCRRRHDDHVRRTELDQHGGQSARHAGQRDDAAVHLLWRLLAPRSRHRHGLPARHDPQTARGRPADRAIWSRRNDRRALDPAGRRRHRRPSLSCRRARSGVEGARRGGGAGDRRQGDEIRSRLSRPRRARVSVRHDDRRRRAQQGAGGRDARLGRRGGAREVAANQAARRRRLRRLPDGASGHGGVAPGDPDPAARAERRDGAGQPVLERARLAHRLRLSGSEGRRCGDEGEGALHRQSRAACGARGG